MDIGDLQGDRAEDGYWSQAQDQAQLGVDLTQLIEAEVPGRIPQALRIHSAGRQVQGPAPRPSLPLAEGGSAQRIALDVVDDAWARTLRSLRVDRRTSWSKAASAEQCCSRMSEADGPLTEVAS